MRKSIILFILILFISFCSLSIAESAELFTDTFNGGLLTTLPWSEGAILEKNLGYETIFSVLCYMDTALHLTNGESVNSAEMNAFQKVLETSVGKSYVNTGNADHAMMTIFTDTQESIIIRYVPSENLITYQRVQGVPDIGDWQNKNQIMAQDFLYVVNEFSKSLPGTVSDK